MTGRPLIYALIEAMAADDRLGPIDQVVAVHIAKAANTDGTNCILSNETLAARAHVCYATARRAVSRLGALGYVDRKRRPNRSAVTTIKIPERSQETTPEIRNGLSLHPERSPEHTRNGHQRPSTVPSTVPSTDQGEPPPSSETLVSIPTKDAGAWELTEKIRAAIAAEYPTVDVVAVARDMAAKIRAGAREPYTHRGMRSGLASWVASEAERIKRGIPGKPPDRDVKAEFAKIIREQHRNRRDSVRSGNYVGSHRGGPLPWHPDDVREFGREEALHPEWDNYLDHQAGRDGPWPRFLDWLSAQPPGPPGSPHPQPHAAGQDPAVDLIGGQHGSF